MTGFQVNVAMNIANTEVAHNILDLNISFRVLNGAIAEDAVYGSLADIAEAGISHYFVDGEAAGQFAAWKVTMNDTNVQVVNIIENRVAVGFS